MIHVKLSPTDIFPFSIRKNTTYKPALALLYRTQSLVLAKVLYELCLMKNIKCLSLSALHSKEQNHHSFPDWESNQ